MNPFNGMWQGSTYEDNDEDYCYDDEIEEEDECAKYPYEI